MSPNQISVEKTGDLGRRMTVQIPAEQIEGQVSSRLNELRRTVRLKGFRPGKVPMNVVRQRYGQQVREEVLQQVMQASLQDAISEQKLKVAGVSRIDPGPLEGEGAFEFTAELEVFPELPEIEVSGLTVQRPVVEITEDDIDDMIETLREQRREWSDAGAPAAKGHRVHIEYVATVDDIRVPEQGHHELRPTLGSEGVFDALEQALTGVEPGQEKEVELSFPEDYRDGQLAGKTALVKMKVRSVEASALPEADEEFAKSFGIVDGMEQMRKDVKRNLEREMRSARTNRLKKAVTDGLAERYKDFTLPKSSIEQEARAMREQMQQQLSQQGQKGELPVEMFTEAAERRVRLGFILSEIARQHDIDIDDGRVQEKIEEIADTYERPSEVIELYRSQPHLLDSVQNMVLEEQVVDWVLDNAQVEDAPMSFKALMDRNPS